MAKSKEAKKSIEEVIKELNKEYGGGSVIHGNETKEYSDVVSTGSLGLDRALGIGGLPKNSGKILEVYGWESSGKSTLTQTIVANYQKAGVKCLLVDGEDSLDAKYATALGVNLKELYVIQLDEYAGEGAYNKMEKLVETGEIGLVVIDSYNSLQPSKIVNGELGDNTLGIHARMLNQAVMKANTLASKYNVLFIFIGQLREKIGVMFGCLHGETLVNFANGTSVPIKTVVENKIQGNVISWNNEYSRFEEKPIIDWHNNGNVDSSSDYIHFETEGLDGQNTIGFTVTPDHQILTKNSWQNAKELTIEDEIISKYKSIVNNTFAEFFYGTMVGDSNINVRKNNTANIKFQDKKNPEYVNWKISKLSKYLTFNKVGERFDSNFSSELKIIREKYPNRRVDGFFLNCSPMSLAVWFMDDAHFDNKKGHCRYKLSIKRLKNDTNAMNYVSLSFSRIFDVSPTFDCSGTFTFTKNDTLKIASLICKYIPECMQYKLPEEFRNKYEDFDLYSKETMKEYYVKIKSIRFASPRQMRTKGKYDISIQDNHNYLVGGAKTGIIVHNSPETTQGGNALRFYAHVRLKVSRSTTKDNSVMSGDVKLGNLTKVKVEKNKLGSPFQECEFNIIYGEGIDKVQELMDIASEDGIIKKYGKTVTYEEVKYDIDEFKKLLIDNVEFQERLRNIILNPQTETNEPTSEIQENA